MRLALICIIITFIQSSQVALGFLEIRPVENQFTTALGQSVVFTCEYFPHSGDKEFDLEWFGKDGKITDAHGRLYVGEDSKNVKKLYITSVNEKDAAEYTCAYGSSYKKSVILQIFKDISFDDAPKQQFVNIHKEGFIKCVVTGMPFPRVSWRFRSLTINPNLDSRYSIEKEGLLIRNVTRTDEGQFVCRAEVDSEGRFDSRKINVFVNYPPTIKLELHEIEVKEGEIAIISCKADGLPLPTFQFYKVTDEGEKLKIDVDRNVIDVDRNMIDVDRNVIDVDENNGKLSVVNVSKKDEGKYICMAINELGHDSQIASLKVLVPPSVLLPTNVTVNSGGTITFDCIGFGDPVPKLSFFRGPDHQALDAVREIDDRINLHQPESNKLTLTINNVKVNDSNIYSCASESSVGYSEKNTLMVVQYGPVFTLDERGTIYYGWPNQIVNISCLVHGEPEVIIHWFYKESDEPITKDEHFQIFQHLGGSVLQVNLTDASADNELYSEYKCRASNLIGDADMYVKLVQISVPDPPVVKLSRIRSDDVLLTIRRNVVNNKPDKITKYHVNIWNGDFWRNNTVLDESDGGGDDDTIDVIIDQLHANESYIASVRAVNVVGTSQEIEIEFTTDIRRVPDQVDVNITSQDSTSLLLSWLPPYSAGSPIFKYIVRHRKVMSTSDGKYKPLTKWIENIIDCCPILSYPPQSVISTQPGGSAHDANEKYLNEQTVLTHEILNLDPSSMYEIKIVAVTSVGTSSSRPGFYARTSEGNINFLPAVLHPSNSSILIGLVVGIIAAIIIIIDITCYVINGCGITMCLCVRACGKSSSPAMKTRLEKETDDGLSRTALKEVPVDPLVQTRMKASEETLAVVIVDNLALKSSKSSFEDEKVECFEIENKMYVSYTQQSEEPEKGFPDDEEADDNGNIFEGDDSNDDGYVVNDNNDDDDDDKLPLPPPPLILSMSSTNEKPELIVPKNRKSIMSFGDARWKDVVQELETQLGVQKVEVQVEDDNEDEYTGPSSPKWKHT